MIVTLLFIIMVLLGLKLMKKGNINDADIAGMILTVLGSILLITSLITILLAQTNAGKDIQENKIEYEGLCKRYDIIKSDPENVFKLDVIKDITAWNIKVYNTKYWCENLWVNWFYSTRVADNLYYIPLDEESEE